MKTFSAALLFISIMACTSERGNQFKKPAYMGFNGQIREIKVSHYFSAISTDNPWGLEIFTFNNDGSLKQRELYSRYNSLLEKDAYKYDSNGFLEEEYKGLDLNSLRYYTEYLWHRIENNDGFEKWQDMMYSSWGTGTSYKEVTYAGDKRFIKSYVIEPDGEMIGITYTTQTVNSKGQIVSEKIAEKDYPEETKTQLYDENGQLIRIELEQIRTDGTINKLVEEPYIQEPYTIIEVDDKNNPTLATNSQGRIKRYKYTYH